MCDLFKFNLLHWTKQKKKKKTDQKTFSDGMSEKFSPEHSLVLLRWNLCFVFNMIFVLASDVSFKICFKNRTKHGGKTIYETMHK